MADSEHATVNYLTADHLGSPRINTDRDGTILARHDYHPFGEEIAEPGGRITDLKYGDDRTRKQFTGYEHDGETGLDFAQARMYTSGLGRFLTADDFANDSHIWDPSSWNKYAYARNSPLKFIDTNGKKSTIIIETDEEKKTVKITIKATIAFYGENGVSLEKVNEAAQKSARKIADAWGRYF